MDRARVRQSISRTASTGAVVEVGLVGWEGLAGTATALDPGRELDVDRVGRDDLRITQEFLSQMLGVCIAGVNEAVQSLERAGIITHARNLITVVNRAALEVAACECYAVVHNEHERAIASRE